MSLCPRLYSTWSCNPCLMPAHRYYRLWTRDVSVLQACEFVCAEFSIFYIWDWYCSTSWSTLDGWFPLAVPCSLTVCFTPSNATSELQTRASIDQWHQYHLGTATFTVVFPSWQWIELERNKGANHEPLLKIWDFWTYNRTMWIFFSGGSACAWTAACWPIPTAA